MLNNLKGAKTLCFKQYIIKHQLEGDIVFLNIVDLVTLLVLIAAAEV